MKPSAHDPSDSSEGSVGRQTFMPGAANPRLSRGPKAWWSSLRSGTRTEHQPAGGDATRVNDEPVEADPQVMAHRNFLRRLRESGL